MVEPYFLKFESRVVLRNVHSVQFSENMPTLPEEKTQTTERTMLQDHFFKSLISLIIATLISYLMTRSARSDESTSFWCGMWVVSWWFIGIPLICLAIDAVAMLLIGDCPIGPNAVHQLESYNLARITTIVLFFIGYLLGGLTNLYPKFGLRVMVEPLENL